MDRLQCNGNQGPGSPQVEMQSICEVMDQYSSTNQPTNQTASQPTNQPITQPVSQSVNVPRAAARARGNK
eukprot:4694451-Lingulodinium_polyedra.AAC.1